MTNKQRYRTNPEQRKKVIERIKRRRASNTELENYRDYVSKRMYALRDKISLYLKKVEHCEKELLFRTEEIQKIRKGITDGHKTLHGIQVKKHRGRKGPRISPTNAQSFSARALQIRESKSGTELHDKNDNGSEGLQENGE